MRPLDQLDGEGDGRPGRPGAAAGAVGGGDAAAPAALLLGRPLFVQGDVGAAVAELLCADRPAAGCHSTWHDTWCARGPCRLCGGAGARARAGDVAQPRADRRLISCVGAMRSRAARPAPRARRPQPLPPPPQALLPRPRHALDRLQGDVRRVCRARPRDRGRHGPVRPHRAAAALRGRVGRLPRVGRRGALQVGARGGAEEVPGAAASAAGAAHLLARRRALPGGVLRGDAARWARTSWPGMLQAAAARAPLHADPTTRPPPLRLTQKASCGFCTAVAADPPGECGDDLTLCPFLAQRGHCTKGRSWMETQCRRSCSLCAARGGGGAAGGAGSSSGGAGGGSSGSPQGASCGGTGRGIRGHPEECAATGSRGCQARAGRGGVRPARPPAPPCPPHPPPPPGGPPPLPPGPQAAAAATSSCRLRRSAAPRARRTARTTTWTAPSGRAADCAAATPPT
jgi:hypothetical protein